MGQDNLRLAGGRYTAREGLIPSGGTLVAGALDTGSGARIAAVVDWERLQR